jgi:hypothetical protein
MHCIVAGLSVAEASYLYSWLVTIAGHSVVYLNETEHRPAHCALNPMYFENTIHSGADDGIQRISMTPLKFSVYFGDVIFSDPAQLSCLGCQGTVSHGHRLNFFCNRIVIILEICLITGPLRKIKQLQILFD